MRRRSRRTVPLSVLLCMVSISCLAAWGDVHGVAPPSAGSEAAPDRGDPWALLIGINDYQHVGDLKFCRQDAEALRTVLVQNAGFSPQRVMTLTDAASDPKNLATRQNIRTRVEQIILSAEKHDAVLIFFAGHVVTLEDGGYLLPVGGEQDDPDSAVSLQWLRGRLSDCKAVTKLLVLDMGRPGLDRPAGSMSIDLQAGRGVAMLTSCAAGQTSYEEGGHGVFSRYLAEGLMGDGDADNDGAITGGELFDYVKSRMSDWCVENRKSQTPQMFPDDARNLVLARIPERQVHYRNAMAEGERLLRAQRWASAGAAFRRALAVPGYEADSRALAGARTARGGADAYRRKTAYDEALRRAQAAYAEAKGKKDKDLWEAVRSFAEEAVRTGHSDLSAARDLLQEAARHFLPPVPAWAKVSIGQIETAQRLGVSVARELDLGGGVKMRLVLIPAGEFMMGSPSSESGRNSDEGPRHRVKMTRLFYIGIHEVTVAQFRRFVSDAGYKTEAEKRDGVYGWTGSRWERRKDFNWRNPGFAQGDSQPVACVSWNDAKAFCEWLSRRTGLGVRLPTEAEWEYACRAGTGAAFSFGNATADLYQHGNYADANTSLAWSDRSRDDGYASTAPAGSFAPNVFGLYDMHGNVWEWCRDRYARDYYEKSPQKDPQGPARGEYRVLRGGSWNGGPWHCRSAVRLRDDPSVTDNAFGFRVLVAR